MPTTPPFGFPAEFGGSSAPSPSSPSFPMGFPHPWGGAEEVPLEPPVSEMPPVVWTGGSPGQIVSPTQIVSLHTIGGVQLYQFMPNDQVSLRWSRDLREVSRCDMTVASTLDYNRIPDIVPWLHWISVFDDTGQSLLWTGPIQKVTANRRVMDIAARDMSALFTRTRCPITKRWDAADPADVADELVAAMIAHHGLNTRTVVRHDPLGDRFDYQAIEGEVMLDSNISDLVGVGLFWSVVAGVPVLGPAPLKPVSSLGEDDFVGEGVQIVRDGTDMFTDVLLRAADELARARVAVSGLSLQTIVDINSMFGVSNANKAAQQYVRYSGSARDIATLPAGAVLHPDAPVTVDQLVPSTRFVVDAFGLLALMQLTAMEVSSVPGQSTVTVTMEIVNDELPELLDLPSSETTAL